MASFDPIIRMGENVFRGPGKMQSKAGRKPLGDLTNSTKPSGKYNKVQAKGARKPLGDLTNTRVQEKSSKKNRVDNVSTVNVQKNNNWIKEEGFLHNHNECMKAQTQSSTMSFDYFLETVGLKKDPAQIPEVPIFSDLELETSMDLTDFEIDMIDICVPPSPPTAKACGSPCWNTDWENLNISPVKLKDSPVRN